MAKQSHVNYRSRERRRDQFKRIENSVTKLKINCCCKEGESYHGIRGIENIK